MARVNTQAVNRPIKHTASIQGQPLKVLLLKVLKTIKLPGNR